MMSTLYENYIVDDDSNFRLNSANDTLAQTFTPQTAHTLTEVKVKVDRVGLPGTVTLYIKAVDDDSKPTGSALSTGTFDGDTLVTEGVYEWKTVTMESVNVLSGTEYAIQMIVAGADSSNLIDWKINANDGAYTRGHTSWSTDGGSTWDNQSNAHDAMFEERGVPTFPSDPTTRVTSIIHRYDRGLYNIELGLGDVISDFGIPEVDSAIKRSYESYKPWRETGNLEEKIEQTARQLEEEADMTREESLYTARKLETLERLNRINQGTVETFLGAAPQQVEPLTPEHEAAIINEIGEYAWRKIKGQQ